MLRRTIRARKEFLKRKALEEQETKTIERKRILRDAINNNQNIPAGLRIDHNPNKKLGKRSLRQTLNMEDDILSHSALNDVDFEYKLLGQLKPRVMLTTSRQPSSRLTSFIKELNLMIPESQRVNRGSHVMTALVDLARKNDITDMVIAHEHRGNPDGLIVVHLPAGPTAYFSLKDVVLRHDLSEKPPNMSIVYPHLVFDKFSGRIGDRVKLILSALFQPGPKPENKRVVSFLNSNDVISVRNHTWLEDKSTKDMKVTLEEQGPRFAMKLYRLEAGTLDMEDVKIEWIYRPHFNSQRKIIDRGEIA